jgi:hypothetical protein
MEGGSLRSRRGKSTYATQTAEETRVSLNNNPASVQAKWRSKDQYPQSLILAALVHQHHAPDLDVHISPSTQSKDLSRAAMQQGKRKEQYDAAQRQEEAATKKAKEEDGCLVAIELANVKAKERMRLLSKPCWDICSHRSRFCAFSIQLMNAKTASFATILQNAGTLQSLGETFLSKEVYKAKMKALVNNAFDQALTAGEDFQVPGVDEGSLEVKVLDDSMAADDRDDDDDSDLD